jgi:hypothetical protein
MSLYFDIRASHSFVRYFAPCFQGTDGPQGLGL